MDSTHAIFVRYCISLLWECHKCIAKNKQLICTCSQSIPHHWITIWVFSFLLKVRFWLLFVILPYSNLLRLYSQKCNFILCEQIQYTIILKWVQHSIWNHCHVLQNYLWVSCIFVESVLYTEKYICWPIVKLVTPKTYILLFRKLYATHLVRIENGSSTHALRKRYMHAQEIHLQFEIPVRCAAIYPVRFKQMYDVKTFRQSNVFCLFCFNIDRGPLHGLVTYNHHIM